MVEREAVVKSRYGLHARPCALISSLSQGLKNTKVFVTNTDTRQRADARSILTLLTLESKTSTLLRVRAEGEEEQRAVDEICKVISEYEAD